MFYLELNAEDGGTSFSLGRADLPIPLPIKVHGVNAHWSTGIWDEDTKVLVPCGTLDGAAIASLDTREKPRHVFIGNIILCNQPTAIVTLLSEGNNKWKVQIQNPTENAMAVTVRTPKAIRAFHVQKTVAVPAGGQMDVSE